MHFEGGTADAHFTSEELALVEQEVSNVNNRFVTQFTRENARKLTKTVLDEYALPPNVAAEYAQKLDGYLYVESYSDMIHGRYLRWMSRPGKEAIPRLHAGGNFCETVIGDNGVSIRCRTYMGRYYTVSFNESVIFIKLTAAELIYQTAADYA
jgi:hypothetical protein